MHARRALAAGTVARCLRCHALLGRGHRLSVAGQSALAVTSLIMLAIGNGFPIVTLELRGIHVETTLPEAVAHTWQTGEPLVAVLAAATALVFPLVVILLRLWLTGSLAAGRRPAGFVHGLRLLRWATRWSMVEVFLLGILIAVVRSAGIAGVVAGPALFSYVALAMLLAAEQESGLHRLWRLGSELPR